MSTLLPRPLREGAGGREATRWLLAALATLTILRLLVAAVTPLSPDEAYYWVWSRTLAPGYLDHPPMIALWIRAGTCLAGDSPFGIRLLGPLSAALGTVLLVRAGEDLVPGRRAGLWAALLINATLVFGIGSVTATPDTPLLLFWTGTLWALARVLRTGRSVYWAAAGAMAGLALDSKYTAILLLPATLVWLLLSPTLRPWLRRSSPYAGAALAALLFAPVAMWNADHDWASFAKQGSRLADWSPARAVQYIAELIAGQIGFATPLLAVLFTAGIAASLRRARSDPAWLLLACLTITPGVVFLQHALGDRVQANWPAILFPAAAIAAAALPRWASWRVPAIVTGLAITVLVWVQGAAGLFPLPVRLDPALMRVGGWQTLADEVAAAAGRQRAAFVASDNYGHAAILARLLPPDLPVLAIDERWALFRLPSADPLIAGRAGLLLRSARRADDPDMSDWRGIERLGLLTRARGGMTAETYRLYRVDGRAGGDEPIVVMPRPGEPR